MSTPTPPGVLRTRNYEAIGEALIATAPKGFKAVGKPTEKRFNDARLLILVQEFARPIRRVEAGTLLAGEEKRLLFTEALPPAVLLPPHQLIDFNPRWYARGLVFERELVKVDSPLGGWPEGPLYGYIWKREPVPPPQSWAAVTWALTLGFTMEGVATFAGAPGCLDVLREGAHHAIQEHVNLLHPRERLIVFQKATKVLPSYSKGDAGGPYCVQLFNEALSQATTAANVADLVALIAALAGEGNGSVSGEAL